jgi:hypothetical protein
MSENLKIFDLLLIVATFVQMALLLVLNKWRGMKLRTFIVDFKKRNLLSDKDYQLLDGRYNGFFRDLEFFPDRADFAMLYEDEIFNRFVTKTEKRLMILAVGTVIGIALTIIFVPMGK